MWPKKRKLYSSIVIFSVLIAVAFAAKEEQKVPTSEVKVISGEKVSVIENSNDLKQSNDVPQQIKTPSVKKALIDPSTVVQNPEVPVLRPPDDSDSIPDSFKSFFYFVIGVSSAALLFILVRIYKLRKTRAERKYGVHGNRSNQELTPLPHAMDDDDSDEDQTLFDINQTVIRVP